MVPINLSGIRLLQNAQSNRVKIDVDCNEKVDCLKDRIADTLKIQKADFVLCYCGNILSEEEILSKYGVKQDVTVHLLKKKVKEPPAPPKKMKEVDILQLSIALKTSKLSPNYRTALQRLSRPDVFQNILAVAPGLSDDLVALALLHDPDILSQFTDIQVLRRVIESHPSLIDVASHIAASVHDDTTNMNPDAPSTSSGYSYSLEALSDDDMDSSSSEGQSGGPSSTQYPNNGSGAGGAGGGIITTEMFNNAMQQVFATVANESQLAAGGGGNESRDEESLESITRRLAPQLNQMRELGLTNMYTNIQALQATGGDVQAAIDLVFSGVLSPGS